MKESLTLAQLTALIMQQAKAKGFGTTPDEIDIPEKIALIHTEVSEAFTAYRHKNIHGKDGFEEELGDIIQRVLHLCGALGIDPEPAILKKLEYNKGRDWEWHNLNESSHSKVRKQRRT
jgi:NTP pyrophosphatase (non-canonical NTP hydrolase)